MERITVKETLAHRSKFNIMFCRQDSNEAKTISMGFQGRKEIGHELWKTQGPTMYSLNK